MKQIQNNTEYLITEDGKVYSKVSQKFLSPSTNECGYLVVGLRGKSYRVHRLVATAFIPNPENKPEVNHIDGDKKNNHISNLEWVTSKENKAHAWNLNLYKDIRQEHCNAVHSDETIHAVCKDLEYGMRNIDICTKYGISKDTVAHIKSGNIWKTISDQYNIKVKRSKTKSINSVLKVCCLLEDGFKDKDVANTTGVDIREVGRIRRGEIFKDIVSTFSFDQESKRLSKEVVINICEHLEGKATPKQISEKLNVSLNIVNKIKRRVSWVKISKNYSW